jgi:hypothetical protein
MTAPKADNGDARYSLAEDLLDLEIRHAPVFAKQEELKEGLRGISATIDAGFSVEIADKGKVKVGKGSVAKFKGRAPELKVEAFLALKEKDQARLIERALVAWVDEYTRDRKPSVSTDPIIPPAKAAPAK